MENEILKPVYGYNTKFANSSNDFKNVMNKIAELRDLNKKLKEDQKKQI